MRSMHFVLPALGALTLLTPTAFMPTAGHADPYKWCAQYGPGGDGGRNCGFLTFDQCMATVSGIGGFCEPNMFYTGPERRARHPRKRYRN